MEAAQSVRFNGVDVKQVIRHYEPRDYEDVDEEFICNWALRKFSGEPVGVKLLQMLYDFVLDNTGPTKRFPMQIDAAAALGISKSTLSSHLYRQRLLAANTDT